MCKSFLTKSAGDKCLPFRPGRLNYDEEVPGARWVDDRTGRDILETQKLSCVPREVNLFFLVVQPVTWSQKKINYPEPHEIYRGVSKRNLWWKKGIIFKLKVQSMSYIAINRLSIFFLIQLNIKHEFRRPEWRSWCGVLLRTGGSGVRFLWRRNFPCRADGLQDPNTLLYNG